MSSPQLQLIGPTNFKDKLCLEVKTIFIDGGLNHLTTLKLTPDDFLDCSSIGDNDSNASSFKIDTLLKPNKDYSDLAFALNSINLNGTKEIKKISLLGFLGKRKDHEFANFFEVISYCEKISDCFISFENKIIITNKENINLNIHGLFSIFTTQDTILSISGNAKYLLDNISIRKFSTHGLSNSADGEISLSNPKKVALMIFLNDPEGL